MHVHPLLVGHTGLLVQPCSRVMAALKKGWWITLYHSQIDSSYVESVICTTLNDIWIVIVFSY